MSASEGNILDNSSLIDTLNNSKTTSNSIGERCAQAELVMEEIDVAREKYRPVAERGSVLYFVIADMAQVNDMYSYSLEYVFM
jgi:dynein heavy chain